jgi:iron complex outermembrane recepter protein
MRRKNVAYLSMNRCLSFVLILVVASASCAADTAVQLPDVVVAGGRVGAPELPVPRTSLHSPEPNLGNELLAIPGVAGHARAADAMEPIIRGLAMDRVATTLDGLPLLNASPERTNSPVVIVGSAAVMGMSVIKALPSVTLGPATTGGRIVLDTELVPTTARTESPKAVWLNSTYDGARDGFSIRGRIAATKESWESHATFFDNNLGDYKAADGRTVAARLRDHGASAGLGWHSATHHINAEFFHRRLVAQETIALPLDGKNTESQIFTITDRWSIGGPALDAVEFRGGYLFTDPYITSENRVAPSLIYAQATARSRSFGGTSHWTLSDGDALAVGADYAWQNRRAVRTTVAGNDYIWPDVVYSDTGLFAEWKRRLIDGWKIRLGARADTVHSNARDVDRLALGRPIRDQFITYNGPAAATIARPDHVGATNALLEWKQSPAASAFIGVGLTVQPAQVMERYRAFLNALGGDGHGGNAVELGNPSLQAERNTAFEIGGTCRQSWVKLEATAYSYHIDDFILRTPIGFTAPPLARMVVFGYRNVDAQLSGAELGAEFKLGASWRVPLTFAYARGERRDTGAGLAEIPPWETTASIRYARTRGKLPFSFDAGVRVVGAKNNPAPQDNPIFGDTGGFWIGHARMGVSIAKTIRGEFGVENIFDRSYTEYLTPPVAPFRPASGDLLPGDRVPAPGRSLWASVTVSW